MSVVAYANRQANVQNDPKSERDAEQNELRKERLRNRVVTGTLVGGFLVILILAWQLVTQLGWLPKYLLPTPFETAVAIWHDLIDVQFWTQQFAQTLLVVAVGFCIAVVAGLLIGVLIVSHPLIERTIYPFVVAFQTMPKIAMAPLLLVWLGYGHTSKFMIAALVAFFPVVVNTVAGLKAGNERQIVLMRSLRASWWVQLKKVRIPNALPYIFAGLDIAVVFAVIGAIVAEFLGSANGLGSLVIVRQTNVDIAGLFSVLFYLAIMGSVLHLIVVGVGRRYTFWADSSGNKESRH